MGKRSNLQKEVCVAHFWYINPWVSEHPWVPLPPVQTQVWGWGWGCELRIKMIHSLPSMTFRGNGVGRVQAPYAPLREVHGVMGGAWGDRRSMG